MFNSLDLLFGLLLLLRLLPGLRLSLLLLSLLLRLNDGLLSVVIVVATADQRQAARADAGPRGSSQQ